MGDFQKLFNDDESAVKRWRLPPKPHGRARTKSRSRDNSNMREWGLRHKKKYRNVATKKYGRGLQAGSSERRSISASNFCTMVFWELENEIWHNCIIVPHGVDREKKRRAGIYLLLLRVVYYLIFS